MINLNGVYFDKITTAKVVQRVGSTPEFTGSNSPYTSSFKHVLFSYYDVEINGVSLGLQLTKEEVEEWLENNLKGE